jgi:hypothetical protein
VAPRVFSWGKTEGTTPPPSTSIALVPSFVGDRGARVTVELPDGTTVGTDAEPGESAALVAERIAVGLRQKGHAAVVDAGVLSGPPMILASRGRS